MFYNLKNKNDALCRDQSNYTWENQPVQSDECMIACGTNQACAIKSPDNKTCDLIQHQTMFPWENNTSGTDETLTQMTRKHMQQAKFIAIAGADYFKINCIM